MYRCLNCGFKFNNPEVVWRKTPLNPGGLWAIDPKALYYSTQVCPKCGSDAIEKVR